MAVGKGPCGRGYQTLADNLTHLHELDSLPLHIDISRLDDGTGIEDCLSKHHAKWHKRCYVMCNKSKVERAKKRLAKRDPSEEYHSPIKKKLRSSLPTATTSSTGDAECAEGRLCFFCGLQQDAKCHKAETFTVDASVYIMAKEMNDTKVLAALLFWRHACTRCHYHKSV